MQSEARKVQLALLSHFNAISDIIMENQSVGLTEALSMLRTQVYNRAVKKYGVKPYRVSKALGVTISAASRQLRSP